MSTEQQEIVAVAAVVQADTCCTCNMFNQEPAYLCLCKMVYFELEIHLDENNILFVHVKIQSKIATCSIARTA